MGKFIMLLIGFGLAVAGGVSMIMYLNLLPAGYSFLDYFHFISGRLECYFFPAGVMLIAISVYQIPSRR